jgi:glucosyl-3-phosphoglycerate synthase
VSVGELCIGPPDATLEAVVVIPARDEAERVDACLEALVAQRAIRPRAYEVILVLDDCRDATRERARAVAVGGRLALHVVDLTRGGGVGRARRLGMDIACERLLEVSRPTGLIASTDADSVVAEDWLAVQLKLLRDGARAIGVRIELDPEEARGLPPQVLAHRRRQAARRMRTVLELSAPSDRSLAEHHQFSGASLAVTAALYRACGGLPAPSALEDEALERTLLRLSIPIHRSNSVRVSTSARTDGRAPLGLAHDLALARRWADGSSTS